MANDTAEKVAESVWTRLVSRAAMIITPVIVTAFGAVILNDLDIRFSQQSDSIAGVKARVDKIESAAGTAIDKADTISARTAVVESTQTILNADTARSQGQITGKLDEIQTSIADLREKTAAIGATVDVLKQRQADGGQTR